MQSFNGGSQLTIAGKGDSDAVARATVNTILGACGAGLTVLILIKFVGAPPGKWSYLATLNGALTGMVQRTPKNNYLWMFYIFRYAKGLHVWRLQPVRALGGHPHRHIRRLRLHRLSQGHAQVRKKIV